MSHIFFYGSLRDPDLVEIVLGRRLWPGSLVPARAPGFATMRMQGEAYPLLLPEKGGVAEGVLLTDAGPEDMRRLGFFEEAEYGLAPITVETDDGPVETHYFRATGKTPPDPRPWEFDHWQRHDRVTALAAAGELMQVFGTVPVAEIDTVWPSIMVRAQQRARAAGLLPSGLRSGFSPEDVMLESTRNLHRGFIALDEYRLRHRRFAGGWSEPISRTTVRSGDAVTVLPYDPVRDEVLLIEQFRPGAFARGEPSAWCIEVVAGRLDGDSSAEEAARREANEEAGLTLGRMEEIAGYFSTPGLASEHMTAFVGEADLGAAGGVHGLAHEHEDIRTFVLPRPEAEVAVADGSINTGPALVSVLWLAANAARLRADWAGS